MEKAGMTLTDKSCADIKAAVALAAEIEAICFNEPWYYDDIMQTASENGGIFAVIYCDNTAAGYVLGRAVYDESELYRIAVHPEYRRRGLAITLLEEFTRQTMQFFSENGITSGRAYLEVRSKNLPARALYEKYGFVILGERKNYYTSPTDNAVLYAKKLEIS